MNPLHPFVSRGLAALALVGSLGAVSASAFSQPAGNNPATATDPAARQERFREHVQNRLQRMEERLQITPAQQNAWAAYRQTVEGLVGTNLAKPGADADAATIARFKAQRAAEHAQKLTQLADATATLQQALTPEQRTTLNEMARREVHAFRGKHRGSR